jgi:hypothetical protein
MIHDKSPYIQFAEYNYIPNNECKALPLTPDVAGAYLPQHLQNSRRDPISCG